ncbi:hypothetical protein [Agrobacterium tumefaciens]|uniref:hypothetical protein n=1 Tax=Agrobacterium tumefaciens TaxID=358 RepID=UPI001FA9B25B|nr:hypothetical protein [Agrobacterium tumefaciens]UNZ49332.1 hypothetical protein MLE07_08000 [Agrobacterium tumefaciens]
MKTAPALHPSLVNATLSGKAAEAEVKMAAEYLADALSRIHGVKFDIDISHETLFVLVCYRGGEPPISPKRGATV